LNLPRFFIAFGYVCATYLVVRFGLGRGKAKASTNCEACGRAYQEPE
jgi:hypothetical protein